MHGDLVAAGRATLAVLLICRQAHVSTLIARSEAADKYRKRFGKSHPDWGGLDELRKAVSATARASAFKPRLCSRFMLHFGINDPKPSLLHS